MCLRAFGWYGLPLALHGLHTLGDTCAQVRPIEVVLVSRQDAAPCRHSLPPLPRNCIVSPECARRSDGDGCGGFASLVLLLHSVAGV